MLGVGIWIVLIEQMIEICQLILKQHRGVYVEYVSKVIAGNLIFRERGPAAPALIKIGKSHFILIHGKVQIRNAV